MMDEFDIIPEVTSEVTELDYEELSDDWEIVDNDDNDEIDSDYLELTYDIRSDPDTLELTDDEPEDDRLEGTVAMNDVNMVEVIDDVPLAASESDIYQRQ